MAIQVRRGAYSDFAPSRMVAGEFANVYSGDPSTDAGTSLYICYTPGHVERILTATDAQKSEAIIASEYSNAETYAVDDLVVKDNTLYRCIVAITSPETWTAAHWENITVAEAIADIQSRLPTTEYTDPNNDGNIVISIGGL